METIYEDIIKRNGYEFRRTCWACPEQYDVFKDDKYVAYIRKRWGRLTVYPVKDSEIAWDNVLYSETDTDPYSGTIENLGATLDRISKALDCARTRGSKTIWIRRK
jgi:hypothetical protein